MWELAVTKLELLEQAEGAGFSPALIAQYVYDAPGENGVHVDVRVAEQLGRYPYTLEWQVAHSVETPR